MTGTVDAPVHVEQVDPASPRVVHLLAALDAELGSAGYTPDQQFGYDVARLVAAGVMLLGAFRDGALVGVGGVEITGDTGELKRCYVVPEQRGAGVADALLAGLIAEARTAGLRLLRLETGIHQHAAVRFYHRNGFHDIPRFGPYVDSETSLCMARGLDAPAPGQRSGTPAGDSGTQAPTG